jgi:predicted ATPase
MLTTLAVENYRSLRDVVLPLSALTVVTGGNGTGKSSLYRAMRLLAESSRGGAVAALAREGGLPSTLWAGPENTSGAVRRGEHPVQGTARKHPVALRLGFAGDSYGYAVDFGLPKPEGHSLFSRDPEIKSEAIWAGPIARPAAMLAQRRGPTTQVRDLDHQWRTVPHQLRTFDSMLSELADPEGSPEVLVVRDLVRSWRFYDHFRTDAEAPARQRQIGTRTTVLGHEGAELAAALQTIREIGDREALAAAIDRAFPGSSVEVIDQDGWFELTLRQHGLLRPLSAAELSDGTLRYLLWTAALLSPRPPELLVLNEPETSLHQDLLAPLAELIAEASTRTQLIIVSHSPQLLSSLGEVAAAEATTVELIKEFGMTRIADQGMLDRPAWAWPNRRS